MAPRFLERKNRIKPPGILLFLIISTLFHLLLFRFLQFETASFEDDIVKLTILPTGNRGLKKKPFKKPPEKKKVEKPKGQVVEIARPKKERKPEQSKFLSRYDSSVKKESRSRFDDRISNLDSKLRRKAATKVNPREIDRKNRLITGKRGKKQGSKKSIRKGSLKGFEGRKGELAKGREKEIKGLISGKAEISKKGVKVGGRSVPANLLPYVTGKEKFLSSPSNDYLKNVAEGEETKLNTRRFLFADFYNRVKRAISYYWDPARLLVIYDPRGTHYGYKNRHTILLIILDKSGNLISAKLKMSSGVDFLDREAINAVKMASPFPNPPEQLLENGRIEFDFGFHVNMKR